MGIVVALVGAFGASLAFVGSLVAMFAGGVGLSAGADDADSFTGKAVLALLSSFVGFAGALSAKNRLRLGAGLLIASAVAGLLLIAWFYVAGALMMGAAAAMALWPASTSPDTD